MSRYRAKPVEVDAMQVTPETWQAVCDFVYEGHSGGAVPAHPGEPMEVVGPPREDFPLIIDTFSGDMRVPVGDWLVRVNGALHQVRADVFEATYEPVEDHT
jgi:hypothetical protein